ncbi:MAG: type I-C CRISPR-associated protein Cas8c/Csd1 [Nitrospira sp.]|nr:type I-C CRISPR-associated protein Cas8c/Csd1 [Nitrospira sp.]
MLEAILRKATDSEPGFSRKKVKWAISCTNDGCFTGVIQLDEGKGRAFDRCPNLSQPELVGGDEPRAHFLAEGLPTVALYWKEDLDLKDQEKFRAKHAYFCRLLEKAATSAPYLAPAVNMLTDDEMVQKIRKDLTRQRAKPTETATVLIDGINPLNRDEWWDWWRQFRSTLHPPSSGGTMMRCFATGELVEAALTHPVKIKGLAGVGGLGVGDVLIGFDKQAFQSYGLEQSANAAVSVGTATAYAETLNRLISEKSTKLGNALAVYWFTSSIPEDDDPLAWIKEPPEQVEASAELKARQLLQAIRTGQRPDLAQSGYVALTLSGAAGRVMVREIMEGSFETLVMNVDRWFTDLSIVARDGKGPCKSQKFLAVAGALVRELDELASPWVQQLWHAAITGGAIPSFAAARTMLRTRVDVINDQAASHARMGLIKAFHIRQGDQNMQPYLNPDHPHPAYHCGRALAVLARLQRAALGDVGAGVVQRFYTAASQSPGLILGRLAANAKNHLGKLEGGLAYWYENQIANVMSRIGDAAPRTLTLEEQSLFALGYYQQLAAFNTGKGGGNTTSGAPQSTTEYKPSQVGERS